MRNKAFIVTHAKARAPLTIKGTSLGDAMEKEGLDPKIWKELSPTEEAEVAPNGDNQGDVEPEDY